MRSKVLGCERNKLPLWLSSTDSAGVRVSPLKGRGGAFQGITAVAGGNDLRVGFVTFYVRDSRSIPLPKEIVTGLRTLMENGDQSAGKFPLAGFQARFLLFDAAASADEFIVGISRVQHWVTIGKAYKVDQDIYQNDASDGAAAAADMRIIWTFFQALATEHGLIENAANQDNRH